jgi:predicted Zn-dependent protease
MACDIGTSQYKSAKSQRPRGFFLFAIPLDKNKTSEVFETSEVLFLNHLSLSPFISGKNPHMALFGRGRGLPVRLIIGIIVAIGALISYFSMNQENPTTGEHQHIGISADQEIALGMQAAPEMAQQYGGEISDERVLSAVREVGNRVVQRSKAASSPYQFQFHVLADDQTINAFALPGGQIFITVGLLKLLKTPGQLAGVLAHETGHVIARHSAEQIAKQRLTQGLTGGAVIATYDPNNPSSRGSAAVAMIIGNLVNLKFSRDDESEADNWGVKLMSEAGYDPNAMIGVMEILRDAAGKQGTPEFFSTHPNPENRITRIQQAIQTEFPGGVPAGLEK